MSETIRTDIDLSSHSLKPPPYESLFPHQPSFPSSSLSGFSAYTDTLSSLSTNPSPSGQSPTYRSPLPRPPSDEAPPGYFEPYWSNFAPLHQEIFISAAQDFAAMDDSPHLQHQTDIVTPSNGQWEIQTMDTNGERQFHLGTCLIFSVINVFFFPPLGIFALIYSMKVRASKQRGDSISAAKYSYTVAWMNGMAMVLGILLYIVLGATLQNYF